MLHYRYLAAVLLAVPASVQAQDPAATPPPSAVAASQGARIMPGNSLRTADGKRAGRVFSLDKAADGSITGVTLIGNGSMLVHVPIATITAVDASHFTTSLSYRQIFH